MFRVLLCPLLDRLRECGFCVVYKMGVALMGGGGRAGVSRCIIGGLVVFFPEGKYYQKLESISPSIFVERKLQLLYVELTSTSLSLA